jgi:hypothetical protein
MMPAPPTASKPCAAMTNNVRLVRATLCANPWIAERVALYGTGLGTECVFRVWGHLQGIRSIRKAVARLKPCRCAVLVPFL